MDKMIAARLTDEDCMKLDRLARRAGLNRSGALRAILRAVDSIEPPKVALSFENGNGAGVRQDMTRTVAA